MKKLLVLAALSAMAMGAKAEATYYDCTFTLSDAKAVYYVTSAFPQTRDAAISAWNGDGGSFTFLSDEMRSLAEVDTWDEFYKVLEGASEANTRGDNNGPYGKPTSNGNGNFTTTQCKNEAGVNTLSWLFLALTEETESLPSHSPNLMNRNAG